MLTIDWILLLLLAVGVVRGLCTGAVKQLLSLASFLIGLVMAQRFYGPLADAFTDVFNYPIACKVFAFVLIWIIVPILLKMFASAVSSTMDKLLVIGTMNRLAGAVLGLLGYSIILGSLIWLFSATTLLSDETMQESKLCGPLKTVPEVIYSVIKG